MEFQIANHPLASVWSYAILAANFILKRESLFFRNANAPWVSGSPAGSPVSQERTGRESECGDLELERVSDVAQKSDFVLEDGP